MTEPNQEIIDVLDLYEWPTEKAVAFLVEELGAPKDEARLWVALAKGETTGCTQMMDEETWADDLDFTGESGPPPRWMVTADAR